MDRRVAAADFLDREHRNRARYRNLPAEFAPRDLKEAYAIQRAFHERLIPRWGPVSGWKIAVTTPAMRRILNIPRPVIGAIFARRIHRAPTRLRAADYIHPGLEFEVALELGSDLPKRSRPYTISEVAPAVAAAFPAFEIVEDRFADYTETLGASLCADNAWNAGIVLGPRTDRPEPELLRASRGMVVFDGRDLGAGMSTPLESLVWLTNELHDNDFPVTKGMIVMTGSLIATQYPRAGSSAHFKVTGLGEADLEFT
jgi:2-keto-4-pentenoate hydratase